MTVYKAGMRLTAGMLADGVTPTVITTGASVPTGFTLTTFRGYQIGGHLAAFYLLINTTSAITATTGNTADTVIATIPAGYLPLDQINMVIGNGSVTGEAWVDPATGNVTVRAASDTIAAGSNIRLDGFFVSAL